MSKDRNFFWVGYADLMTSMFFVMMVLFILTVSKLYVKVGVLEKEKEILETVKKNAEKLKENETLFAYDDKYKRYTLVFDVQFKRDKAGISSTDLMNYDETQAKLIETGLKLKEVIDGLKELQNQNEAYKNVSYMIVVAGSSSNIGNQDHNYELSYNRAYNLYKFWKRNGIDLDEKAYHDLVEFQIAGNGIGGVNRIRPLEGMSYNAKNQCFIINIVPKIGQATLK